MSEATPRVSAQFRDESWLKSKLESQPLRLHVGEQLHGIISHLLYYPVLMNDLNIKNLIYSTTPMESNYQELLQHLLTDKGLITINRKYCRDGNVHQHLPLRSMPQHYPW